MNQAVTTQRVLEGQEKLSSALDSGRYLGLLAPAASGVMTTLKELLDRRGETVAEFYLQNGTSIQELLWEKTVSLSSSSGEEVAPTAFARALKDGKAVLVELLGDFRGAPPAEEYRELLGKIGSALAGNQKSVELTIGDEVRVLELNPEQGRLIVREYSLPEPSPLVDLRKS